ncbi:MAG: TonB-dependent siderophore receptor [Acidobacteria bacterium]|nr:TonB-dependent siderophore receptor [Acidobacteriota bacterium]MCA1648927.1 TonB-dependent siderophore receptor [Acidobacteriota bacterium]
MRRVSVIVLTCQILTCGFRVASAEQADSKPRTVEGTVVDATGAVMPAVGIVLKPQSGSERSARTDGAGHFAFQGVSGAAQILARTGGFAPATHSLSASETFVRVILQPIPVTERVTVTASRPTERPITSATKTETLPRDVPQAITVVTRKLISDRSMQGMADVVWMVPGLGMAQGEGNRDTPIFRGNPTTSDFFVDGVRDDAQYFRDVYNVERIEVLKGPNAMIFGRGGVGGVINRVTRQAERTRNREARLELGSYGHRRMSGDVGQPFGSAAAFRANAVYENSDTYRSGVGVERYGVNPTFTTVVGNRTIWKAGYEYFHDDRTADRGVPSFGSRPVATAASTFFGNPGLSHSRATVNSLTSSVEHRLGNGWMLHSRISFANYAKFYQNVYAGSAVDPGGTEVNLAAYNNATGRTNVFSQTDLVARSATGRIDHTLLAGIELGRQATDNLRNTGYFGAAGSTTSVAVPVTNSITSLPVVFRQSTTDANNEGVAQVAAVYVQDQIAISSRLLAIAGVRLDLFDVDFHNNRTGVSLGTRDHLVSPRAGLIFKPIPPLSVYGSYAMSYLPRAGEQLSSLSLTNRTLDPEEFRNREFGVKWQVHPALAFSAAAYRLNRGNVSVADPVDPTRSLLVDGQRTSGIELEFSGNVTRAWSVVGAYAYQDARITRTQSASVRAGATLAQVPRHAFSTWNRFELTPRLGVALGLIQRGDVFAATDNTVTLPAFMRVDGAMFFQLTTRLRAQANIENLLDDRYHLYANGNNNITPGSPRAVRMALIAQF